MLKLMQFFLTLALVAQLLGCAAMKAQEITGYCSSLAQNAELRPLDGKVPMFMAKDITADMMARRDVPTAEDVPVLRIWLSYLDQCRGRWRDAVQGSQIAPLQTLDFKTNLLIAKLLNREITYGNANVLALEAYVDYTHESGATAERDAERRAQAARALLDASARVLAASERQRPQVRVTTCSWVGGFLHCASQ